MKEMPDFLYPKRKRMEHYFSNKPVARARKKEINYEWKGNAYSFETSSSVFSRTGIDKGTAVLIEHACLPEKGMLLDLGCGYGAVGIIIKRQYPSLDVVMSEVNERAIMLAKKNAARNGVPVDIRQGSLFEKVPESFDVILLNPPQHAGKELCLLMIEQSFDHLKVGGSLQIVARHQKGGIDLSNKMESVFGNVETIGRKSGYHVYLSQKI